MTPELQALLTEAETIIMWHGDNPPSTHRVIRKLSNAVRELDARLDYSDELYRLRNAVREIGDFLHYKGEKFRTGEGALLLDKYEAALHPTNRKAGK